MMIKGIPIAYLVASAIIVIGISAVYLGVMNAEIQKNIPTIINDIRNVNQSSSNVPSENETKETIKPIENLTDKTKSMSIVVNQTRRLADTITKIQHEKNKDSIQQQLDELSYASILFTIDEPKNIDSVLSSLSADEFKLEEISSVPPPIISGNATKDALNKLQNNLHVIRIYYNTREKTEPLLQDSVLLIKANYDYSTGLTFPRIDAYRSVVVVTG